MAVTMRTIVDIFINEGVTYFISCRNDFVDIVGNAINLAVIAVDSLESLHLGTEVAIKWFPE